MKKKDLKCLSCNSEKLIHYTEKNITEYRKINADGTISKRKTEGSPDYNNPWGLQCCDCGELFNYEINDKGVITVIYEK